MAELTTVGLVDGSEAVGAGLKDGVGVAGAPKDVEAEAETEAAALVDDDGLATIIGAHVTRTFIAMNTAATPTPATAKNGTASPARVRSDFLRVNMARVCRTWASPAKPRSPSCQATAMCAREAREESEA